MHAQEPSWVPKVHPLARGVEAEDPMELIATTAVGDPVVMLESFVQEFAQLGLGPDELFQMFQSPAYPVLHQLAEYLGADELRRRVDELLARTGVFRVHESFVEELEPEADEPHELIQLTVRRKVQDRECV